MADEVAPEPEVVDPAEEINSAISNLDRLESDVVQELEQVESQMGLKPGALAMPGQMAAYQNDPSRFNQELFERAKNF